MKTRPPKKNPQNPKKKQTKKPHTHENQPSLYNVLLRKSTGKKYCKGSIWMPIFQNLLNSILNIVIDNSAIFGKALSSGSKLIHSLAKEIKNEFNNVPFLSQQNLVMILSFLHLKSCNRGFVYNYQSVKSMKHF